MENQIAQLIEIQGGYTSYVDLKLELFEDSRNIGRMSRYRPVTAHRQAFEKLAQSLNVKDGRCYLLRGAYGTGKSHLCMMFANYLQTPSGEKPMPDFLKHYEEADQNAASELRAKRKNGRYLVALCDWGGHGDFEEIVLRAVDEALHREGFNEDFDTHYLQAVKKVEEWEQLEREGQDEGRFLERFNEALESFTPVQTIDKFKLRLRSFDYAALEDFKRIHKEITTAPFNYDKSNLLSILTETLSSSKFKDLYQGLLVLFDEFGDTMERGHLSPKMFQQFAQLASDTPPQCARLIFVGTAHKSLTDYAKAYDAVDFRTASDRIKEVELTPNGVEDIIAAIIKVNQEHSLWKEIVAPRSTVFDGFLTECTRLKLFDWLTGPRIRKRIIEAIYPMHPMATYALLRLAQDIASNNRSVFTFFAGDLGGEPAAGSYGEFIATQPVEQNGKLSLYTTDRLFDYFSAALSSDNKELRDTLRRFVRDYENAVRELNRLTNQDMATRLMFQNDTLIPRLLRLMLIYDLVQIPNRAENLAFGLYCITDAEKAELKNRLQNLADRGILYLAKDKDEYEFRKSDGINLDQLVEEYKKDPKNTPANLVAEIEVHVPLPKSEMFMVANEYNNPYHEDKRLERRIVRSADLGSEINTPQGKRTFFDQVEGELEANARKSDCEGIALYVLCETVDEIQRARNFSAQNKSDRIVIALPCNPIPFLDAVMEVKALKYIDASDQSKNFTNQDKSALNSRLHGDSSRKGAIQALQELRDRLLTHREVQWYSKLANPLPVDANKPADAANRVMEKLYSTHHNRFPHDDFNRLRFKLDRTKNVALKEAVETLLDFTEPIVIDTGASAARGERRYLETCLLQNGVLRQVKADGPKLRCEFEKDVSKYASKLPFLAAMIQDIQNLSSSARLNITEWLTKYRKQPYGQGPISLSLALACIRRYFGDSVLIKQEESSLIGMTLREFDDIVYLVDGYYAQAFLTYRPLSPEERALANQVFIVFGKASSAAKAVNDVTLQEAYTALLNWWQGLPPLARASQLYTTGPSVLTTFLNTMEAIVSKDPHSFLLDDLPGAFGVDQGMAITQDTVDLLAAQLPNVKQSLEQALQGVEDRIIEAVRQIFDVQQIAYSGIIDAIAAWYDTLDTNQRDSFAPWHDNDSKPLVIHLKTATDLRETFLERIPASPDYGFKRVPDWITDHVDEYTERIRRGKQRIEEHRLKVDAPEIALTGKYQQENSVVTFSDKVIITLKPKKTGDRIYIAEGQADPSSPASARVEYTNEAQIEIRERKVIHYVACDADGNWGRVETLELINEAKKHEIAIQESFTKGPIATFNFPKDTNGFIAACRSLFKLGVDRKVISKQDLENVIKALLEEISGS